MHILQAGLPKSGNTWIFNIIQRLLETNNIPINSYIKSHPIFPLSQEWREPYRTQGTMDTLQILRQNCFWQIGPVVRMPIDDIDDYISQTTHVWTHSDWCARSLEVLPKFDKIVYILRDPRDVLISMAHFVFTPYLKHHHPNPLPTPEAFIQQRLPDVTRHWVRHVGHYLRHHKKLNIHIVFYEQLLHNFDQELTRLSTYLELPLTPQQHQNLKTAVSKKSMRQRHPDHIRSGTNNQWVATLTAQQQREVLHIARPMLSLLHYPHTPTQAKHLPRLPRRTSPLALQKAIRHSTRRTPRELLANVTKLRIAW